MKTFEIIILSNHLGGEGGGMSISAPIQGNLVVSHLDLLIATNYCAIVGAMIMILVLA
jgi:hypothetical protein